MSFYIHYTVTLGRAYYNLSKSQIRRLRQIQNSLAPVVVKLLNSLTPLLFSNLFTGLKLMNVFNIKFSISPSNFSIPRNLPTCMTWSLQTPRNTRSSSVVTLARPPTRSSLKITSHSFRYASLYLWNQLHHSLRQPRLDLPLPDSSLLHSHLTSRVSSSPLIIHHPIILLFQPQNFFFSNSPSIDIWHLFRLNPRINGLPGANIPCLQARTCFETRNPCLKSRKYVLELLAMFHHCSSLLWQVCHFMPS